MPSAATTSFDRAAPAREKLMIKGRWAVDQSIANFHVNVWTIIAFLAQLTSK